MQACVRGAVHNAHAAGADLGIDAVGAELLARNKKNGGTGSAIRMFPRGAIQQTIARTTVKQQRLHRTPYLGVRLYQECVARFAAGLQRPVIERFNLLPCFGIRWAPSRSSAPILSQPPRPGRVP
jgi:hypothetical protein